MGTELDARGVDTRNALWSALALTAAPDVVREVHADYLGAGARVITTNTYQATLPALVRSGEDVAGAREVIAAGARLAKEAARRFATEHPEDPASMNAGPQVPGAMGVSGLPATGRPDGVSGGSPRSGVSDAAQSGDLESAVALVAGTAQPQWIARRRGPAPQAGKEAHYASVAGTGLALLVGAWDSLRDVAASRDPSQDHRTLAHLTRVPAGVWLASWFLVDAAATGVVVLALRDLL